MHIEIERKFLASIDDALLKPHQVVHIQQVYLSVSPEIRLRQIMACHDPVSYRMTFKGKGTTQRREHEFTVTEEEWDAACEFRFGDVIRKMRHIIDGWEIDCYYGFLSGLVIAECELPHPDAEIAPLPLGITLHDEVTNDSRYKNITLALSGLPR